MVTPIRDILKTAVKGWGLAPAAQLVVVREAWTRVVGEALAGLSAPLSIRDGRLRVAVVHPAAAQEIRFQGGKIAAAINSEAGERVVSSVIPVSRRRLPDPARRANDQRRTPHRSKR